IGVPHQAAFFTGREAELAALEQSFTAQDRVLVTQSIAGLGGVGKTQLAVRYVHAHLHEYEVVIWVRVEDGGARDLRAAARELELAGADIAPAEAAERVIAWLGRCEQRWLLVLDNVPDPEQVQRLAPSAGNGRVLITSRHRGLAQFGSAVTLQVFDQDT